MMAIMYLYRMKDYLIGEIAEAIGDDRRLVTKKDSGKGIWGSSSSSRAKMERLNKNGGSTSQSHFYTRQREAVVFPVV